MSKAIPTSKFRQIGEITSDLVKDMNLADPWISIIRLAKRLNVEIQETDLGGDISGMLIINGKDAVIAVNKDQIPERKRFTIAHELGHFVLHREDNNNVFVDRDFIVKYRSNKPYSDLEIRQEQEANAFAASLLMPQDLVLEQFSKNDFQDLPEPELIDKLARLFMVSVPAMTFRLLNLNILFN